MWGLPGPQQQLVPAFEPKLAEPGQTSTLNLKLTLHAVRGKRAKAQGAIRYAGRGKVAEVQAGYHSSPGARHPSPEARYSEQKGDAGFPRSPVSLPPEPGKQVETSPRAWCFGCFSAFSRCFGLPKASNEYLWPPCARSGCPWLQETENYRACGEGGCVQSHQFEAHYHPNGIAVEGDVMHRRLWH